MADGVDETIEIELVYALAHAQLTETLRVRPGTTLAQAVSKSCVVACHPDVATGLLATGIWGHLAEPTAELREYDRIEFYRPLVADPKQARRVRARRGGKLNR
jgi:putative ubiquitin-RnfH superfamily antitoxin RatB of RatAB toxin-antitoxin module